MFFKKWCQTYEVLVGKHRLRILTENAAERANVETLIDRAVMNNYDDFARLEDWARTLGLPNAATVLKDTLPTTRQAKSGHIGEVLLTESIPELFAGFSVPIKRLRWLDGRNMALRGEDFIGIDRRTNTARFLKAESKSRAKLAKTVVTDARAALESHDGRPSPHAMLFVARRLDEIGDAAMALAFLEYTKRLPISPAQLVHVLFTFSGNDSTALLRENLAACVSTIEQHAVGIVVVDHQKFIEEIYVRLADAANP